MPRRTSTSDSDCSSLPPCLGELPPASPLRSLPSTKKSNDGYGSPIVSQLSASPRFPCATYDRGLLMTPKDRFRSSVKKVINIKRMYGFTAKHRVGAEPGIDVRCAAASNAYNHFKTNCVIEIAEYSTIRSSFGTMSNREFVNYLEDTAASKREPWVKVRWINIGGVSWDVVRALALKYDIHPLALEDILHHPNRVRSKTDYYPQHLFLRIVSHTLAKEYNSNTDMHEVPRSEPPEPMDEETNIPTEGTKPLNMGYNPTSGFQSRPRRASIQNDLENGTTFQDPASETFGSFSPSIVTKQNAKTFRLIQELKRGDRVNVVLNPMCIFLFRDGTVISMHPKNNLEFTAPISDRLRVRSTSLRSTADPSLLVHALLDLVVDSALEVVDEYQSKILKIEHDILLQPMMKSVRFLHILSGDLTLHKRTLDPIKSVIYSLRRYDGDRVAAMYDPAEQPAGWKAEGYLSFQAKTGLADVHDHAEYILNSLDMFASIAENLINYTFNMASHEMNEVMRKLTLVTIFCLPLTLLTGYFGMNFYSMNSVTFHTDLFFWEVAIPMMIVLIPLLMQSDMVKLFHYFRKNVWAKKIENRPRNSRGGYR